MLKKKFIKTSFAMSVLLLLGSFVIYQNCDKAEKGIADIASTSKIVLAIGKTATNIGQTVTLDLNAGDMLYGLVSKTSSSGVYVCFDHPTNSTKCTASTPPGPNWIDISANASFVKKSETEWSFTLTNEALKTISNGDWYLNIYDTHKSKNYYLSNVVRLTITNSPTP